MEQPRGGELALMTFGAILVAGAVQRSGDAAVEGVRLDVLRKFGMARRRWRRRGTTASTSAELVVGVAIVLYALARTARAAALALQDDSAPFDTPPVEPSPSGVAAAA